MGNRATAGVTLSLGNVPCRASTAVAYTAV
jgi:hypothetical protein